MSYWWDDDPGERYWVEIRYVEGIGMDLSCPLANKTDGANPWYDLVSAVKPGDIVYHWQATEHRFVGRSCVASAPRVENDTRVVDLEGFQPVRTGVDRPHLLHLEDQLIDTRDRLSRRYPGQRLYLPFQHRTDGIRLLSNYFAKLPAEAAQVLFGEDGLGDALAGPAPNDEGPDGPRPAPRVRAAFLKPFKPRADREYLSRIVGGIQRRGRGHEALVNQFASWLEARGFTVGYNAAIDLGLKDPPVVIEAKVTKHWPTAIRQAVGQLYEYRYFQVVDPTSGLLFLAASSVPDEWIRYLERDRRIGAAWRHGSDFRLSALGSRILGVD